MGTSASQSTWFSSWCSSTTSCPWRSSSPSSSPPLGALVGRQLTESGLWNPAWTGKKTIGGSLAVFLATIATLTFGSWAQKLALSLLVALAEGLSCDYDN